MNLVQERLRALGFGINGQEEYGRLVDRAVERAEQVSVPDGTYFVYRPGGGAQVWIGRREEGGRESFGGLTPWHEGEGRVRFGVDDVECDADYPMEGFVSGWAAPQGGFGAYPCTILVPDVAAVAPRLQLPAAVDIHCSALATAVRCFWDEDDFQHRSKDGMAPASLIPVCTFQDEPPGRVLFCGSIRKAELRHNPDEAGGRYWWLLVDTHEATVDVVTAPSDLTGDVVVGGIAQVTATLVGRIRDR